jgi:hypothetical protein
LRGGAGGAVPVLRGIARTIPEVSFREGGTVARVINIAASLPHFWISVSTLMIRFTRSRGSWVVGSLAAVRFALGGGVGDIKARGA